MVTFAVSAHNVHDWAGDPSLAADVCFIVEAEARTIRAKARALRRKTGARLSGKRVLVCKQQKDLVLVVARDLFKVESVEYHLAHKGVAKVTPHRGTFVVKGRFRKTGRKAAFVVEHRINSWWKNERGEKAFRAKCWVEHTGLTLSIIGVLHMDGYVVFAGGDLNTPRNVLGYRGVLTEVSTSLDRLACSPWASLSDFRRGPKRGSDHHEIEATASTFKE